MKHFLCLLLAFLLVLNLKGQDSTFMKWKFSLMSEAISLPSLKVIKKPIHPGFVIGYNLKTKTQKKHSHVFDANFGYYHHPLMGNSFMLWTEYRFEQQFLKKFSAEGIGGLGYKHNIADRTVYKRKNDDTFGKVTDWGSPQAFALIGLGLGYDLNLQFKIYCDYKSMLALPFAKLIPIGIHTLFNVGLQVKFKKEK